MLVSIRPGAQPLQDIVQPRRPEESRGSRRRTSSRGTPRCPRCRPRGRCPDCLTPPKGAPAFETMPWFRPTMPVSSRSHDPDRALDVAREDVGHEAVLGVVGPLDRLVLGREARDRGDRAEDLLAEHARLGGHVGEHRRAGRSSRGRPGASPPVRRLAPLSTRVLDQLGHLLARGLVDQRPDLHVLLGAAAELERAHLLAPAGA